MKNFKLEIPTHFKKSIINLRKIFKTVLKNSKNLRKLKFDNNLIEFFFSKKNLKAKI